MTTDRNEASELYGLLDLFQKGDLNAQDFCRAFEQAYNFDIDRGQLTPREARAFAELFDQVVWFSPDPDERREIPHYIGEDDVAKAVANAAASLRDHDL